MGNNIKTQFAGVELSNPIIAASCSLTGTAKSNEMLAKAGVGAIVLKSLFEEDIIRESAALSQAAEHTEAADYMQAYIASNALSGYISLIQESKALCGSTPIIASINCANNGEWIEYARAIEAAGADALELNVMTVESGLMSEDGELERRHIAIAKAVREVVKLPLIMKLSAQLSNHVSVVSRLEACGINGFVLFNRAYPLDIDINTMNYTHGAILSERADFATPLRHTAIVSAAVPKASLALSGGAQSGECIIKSILAGAAAVEVCSTLYRQGKDVEAWISTTLEQIAAWQSKQGFDSIEEFRAKMNSKSDEHRDSVMRTQFLKHFGTYQL
ncbi:MAG: dihydroorotate dehydrogenase-like protein [Rikenellaceae bacterium]